MPFCDTDSSFFSAFPKFTIISIVSFGVYLLMSKLLRLPEVDPILKKDKKLLFGRLDGVWR